MWLIMPPVTAAWAATELFCFLHMFLSHCLSCIMFMMYTYACCLVSLSPLSPSLFVFLLPLVFLAAAVSPAVHLT